MTPGMPRTSTSAMGIKQLWEIVAPSCKETTLSALAFQNCKEKKRDLIIGLDIRYVLNSCDMIQNSSLTLNQYLVSQLQAALLGSKSRTHAELGENPELCNIFSCLAHFSHLPITLLTVFDGPGRPGNKHCKKVIKKHHWMIKRVQEMLRDFGFHYYTAPSEAEAELAYLNKLGYIDAVLMDDSDALVFGVELII
ncbi:hypothetical protein D9758_010003 [Tetrapyrgos nigripes]|uniref:XPG-I domain-containing protein n=1 Tax=Tetrapyrgos nigripes TaxID=182062 RepID=A0A8H5FT38_9AGAR|nr:hypothetical protein D9758_010003 [Tetrapyrgos nigripes]